MTPSQPTLVIVAGLPGSGKTTYAKALAARTGGLRMSPDEWMESLGASLWNESLRELIETTQWSMAEDFLRAGTSVILEWGTWSRAERELLGRQAREWGALAHLVVLAPPIDELWRRVQERGMEDPPMTYDQLLAGAAYFELPDDAERLTFDRTEVLG